MIAGAALPWFNRAYDHLVNQQYLSVDLLDALWIGLHTLNGQFVAPALKTSLAGGRADLRDRLSNRRQTQDANLMSPGDSLLPAKFSCDRGLTQKQMQVGDQMRVSRGDRIPVDGPVITSTQTCPDTTWAEVERVAGDTCADLVAEILRVEPVYDTRIAAAQATIARAAVLPTLCLGAGIFATTGMYAAAIAPFQLDFGSGIQLSLRTVFLSALVEAARQGVYIRSAGALETLAQIDAIVWDCPQLLQPEPSQFLNHLRTWGIEVHVLQSEDYKPEISTQLAISLDGLPRDRQIEQKLAVVRRLQSQGKSIAWLGDGVTDVAAAEQASLSISFTGRSHLEHRAADIVLLEPDGQRLLWAIATARKTLQQVYQNTALISLPSLIVVIGGVFFGLSPEINVITNNTTALIAEFLLGSPLSLPPTPKLPLSTTSPVQDSGTAIPVFLPA